MTINLKYERLKRGMTQQQLADKVGVSYSCISRLEGGCRKSETLEIFDKICAALGCKLGDILQLSK